MKFTIEVGADGRLHITGPLHDKVSCLGLLELAKDAVKSYRAAPPEQTKNLVGPDGGPASRLNGIVQEPGVN